jgi:Protein of unknown function (DUF5672)
MRLHPAVWLCTTAAVAAAIFWYATAGKSSNELIAVLLETHPPTNLPPIALHFLSVLGPRWKIHIYTLEHNWVIPVSVPFQRALNLGHIKINYLPPDTDLSDGHKVSEFLTTPWLWEQLQHARHTLMFQLDSIICANSEQKVEDFLHFDFVGAPIRPGLGRGYNGGLSLRNPRLFLEIAREEVLDGNGNGWEDQWFYAMAERRLDKGVRLATIEEAQRFASETMPSERPLGYHQVLRWLPDQADVVMDWCPEIGMAGKKRTPDD